MKNATCYLHGRDLRPTLCNDCARASRAPVQIVPPTRTIRLIPSDFQAMEKVIDRQGKIGFRERFPIARPDVTDPWAFA